MSEYCKYCESCQCGCNTRQEHHEDHCHCEEKFLKLANDAWMETLKEKIKAKIEKNEGDSLEKLADIIAKANADKWKHQITIKSHCEDYKNTLKDFFVSKY